MEEGVMICLHCEAGDNRCTCSTDPEVLLEDVEGDYFLSVVLPRALKRYKDEHGEWPVRRWNKGGPPRERERARGSFPPPHNLP